MDLSNINTDAYREQLRNQLASIYPTHESLNYGMILKTINDRGLELWKKEIVPELGRERVTEFELALDTIQIRAGHSIPWSMASGYSFAIACHDLAGGKEEGREAVGVTAGLGMVIVSIFDRLVDEYPDQLGGTGREMRDPLLDEWLEGKNLDIDWSGDRGILATGFLNLFRLFIQRCHHLLNKDKINESVFADAVRLAVGTELDTSARNMKTIKPSEDLVDACEQASVGAYLTLGLIAALPLDKKAALKIDSFARDYARLTWIVDDLTDLKEDSEKHIWNGLSARLALSDSSEESINHVIEAVAEDCSIILKRIIASCKEMKWDNDDVFSLADILWAYLWVWLGGEYQIPLSTRHPNPIVSK